MNRKPILRHLRIFTLASLALVASAYGVAQTTTSVNLTAQRMSLQLPDGNRAPMWGFCATPTAGTNPACSPSWAQGPQINVPAGNSLHITLTNNLPTFTSIVILGQIGEECGASPCSPTWMDSPIHGAKTETTWPANGQGSFTPPQQGMRMKSFVAEAAPNGGTQTYTWASTTLKPGTYLYETGSNPSIQAPMGLYGVVVVTTLPGSNPGQAYPGAFSSSAGTTLHLTNVPYDADAVMLISEIDLKQNTAVDALAANAASGGTIDPWTYPPAINYAPTYFLMNGAPYDRSNPSGIPIANSSATSPTGRVLLRFANAGLQTHVPSVVGMNLSLFAEDGNVLPGMPKVQTEVLLPAGKTEDVAIYPIATAPGTFAAQTVGVYDRSLGLSAGNTPDSGIQAFLQLGGASLPAGITPKAANDTFNKVPNDAVTYSGNVLSNDTAIYNPKVITQPATPGSVSFSSDGTGMFTYSSGLPSGSTFLGATFTYCGNGDTSGIGALCATVTLTAGNTTIAPPTANNVTFTRAISSYFQSSHPGALTNSSDPAGLTLTARFVDPKNPPAGVTLNPDGSFIAVGAVSSFQFVAVNSQGIASSKSTPGAVYLNTPAGQANGLQVSVVDALDYANKRALTPLTDYRWTIEEDTTYKNDAQYTGANGAAVPSSTLAVNFHKSYMPVVATGCYGTLSCGDGQLWNGSSTPPANAIQPNVSVKPSDVYLDPARHYYISILPGDAVNAFASGTGSAGTDASGNPVPFNPATCTTGTAVGSCGHTMGGATIDPGQKNVQVLVEPNPLQTAQLSVFIFEDNNPTNGDIDGPEETLGLGGFQITVTDAGGRTGDPVGQMTYDAFNYPLTNSLMGTYECPAVDANGALLPNSMAADYNAATGKGSLNGGHKTPPGRFLQGMIITCPSGTHPLDGTVNAGQPYALAGQALIKNLMPGRFDVSANPAAGREQAGEKWYQVSTLEGTRGQDAFAKVGEPAYFQEFGPPGFHTFIGFVNPDHVNNLVNPTLPGTKYVVSGSIVNLHMSRPVAEGLYPGSHVPLSQTTCYVSLNENAGSGRNVAFAQCNQDGTFALPGVPSGAYQLVAWDEWLDQIIAYKNVIVGTSNVATGPINVFSWFTRLETNTFLNPDGTHKPSANNDPVAQVPTTIRFRDGSISNVLKTDSSGNATFHELFPLFNWYVAESDQTRFAGFADSTNSGTANQGGVHVVVDGGGIPDVKGDYAGILTSHYPTDPTGSTEQEYPNTQYLGLQGFIGQTEILNWEKREYRDATTDSTGKVTPAENGGITGTVVYASTRPFDDPRLGFQNLWEPLVPRVTINLYHEATALDGSKGLTLVNTTQTSSWDDYVATDPATGKQTNMSCPGQMNNGSDPFVAHTLGTSNATKCYDGFHMWNQVQPAFYDGLYVFTTLADGITPLPVGKYVVEMVTPPGYTLVKEEDKNILMGDAFIAPLYSQFGSLSNIFILPDQATVGQYNNNPNNPNNSTTDLGHPTNNILYPACVGASHRVPDFMTLFPGSGQVAPFAGADRPLCDRKEVILGDKVQANATFFVYTEAHIASHFTGMILDDAAAEINAASPDFGEKFAVPFVPVSIKDFNGIEISRLHADQWGTFNGLTPSSWQVNVPNPAGYSPNMLITCMNDPGPISDGKGGMITDPAYNPMFSNFCYTNPFMPGLTDYLDTPVLQVAAFAAGYNPVDCAYPVGNPAIKSVTTSYAGAFPAPFLTPAGGTVTITALGAVAVPNPAYAGPLVTGSAPTINRTYGFGATRGTVTLGGVDVTRYLASNGWTDGVITLNLPRGIAGGQLVVTNHAGISTTEAVTLTIEATTASSPKYVSGKHNQKIQDAIDAAIPGDLILIDAGTYNELVIMDKPVRLQGIGANQVIINAAKYPTTKLASWRPRINADFGIDADGNQLAGPLVDPLPGQEITGGVVLLEPSVLATEEGAGIAVLARNIRPTAGAIGSPACQVASTTAAAFNQKTAYNFACLSASVSPTSKVWQVAASISIPTSRFITTPLPITSRFPTTRSTATQATSMAVLPTVRLKRTRVALEPVPVSPCVPVLTTTRSPTTTSAATTA